MKKGYYVFNCSTDDQKELQSSGVYKKIVSQCKVINEKFHIELFSVKNDGNISIQKKITSRLPFTAIGNNWVKVYSDLKDADFIYFRRVLNDCSLINLFRKLKENNKKIVILYEIPTFPYDKELTGIKNFPFKVKDILNRKRLKPFVDVAVTYSNDDKIFDIRALKLLNGIDFSSIKMASSVTSANDSINLIAVAVHSFWHGYDRLIKGLSNYYRNGGVENIRFHVVGDGISIKSYKLLVEKLELNDHVIFYGKLSGAQLDAVYDKCDIAIESLGDHRRDVHLSSSLKSCEYCAKGLPLITSTDINFIDDDFPYCMKVPKDESDVDIDLVVNFYHKCYPIDKDVLNIRRSIRSYGEKKIDMSITMSPVIEYLHEALAK